MTPSTIRISVVTERAAWVRRMLDGIRSLPVATIEDFESDPRNSAAAESYLRRALEGLLDLGRHVLAKAYGVGDVEYKAIASSLVQHEVITPASGVKLTEMAGYRNRMVHFYSELTNPELHQICTSQLHEVEEVLTEILTWIKDHPETCDRDL